MTARATQVFEQVKALTADERSQLAELLTDLAAIDETVPKFQMPDYAARLKRDFPNGIVIDDPQAFWDEAREERIDFVR